MKGIGTKTGGRVMKPVTGTESFDAETEKRVYQRGQDAKGVVLLVGEQVQKKKLERSGQNSGSGSCPGLGLV